VTAGWRLPLLAAAFGLLTACAAAPERNVVVITLDTTRADHLGCYGYRRDTTPRLDALATEGTLFESCLTPVPITLPSHATIFTGTYPPHHGVRDNAGFELPDHVTTLAEVLAARGYLTAAFIGAFPLDSRFRLDQGFQLYDDRLAPPSGDPRGLAPADQLFFKERKADEVTQAALAWLDRKPDGPFFVWLHYFDPHMPCNAPEPFSQLFTDSPYDAEIAFADDSIGRFLDALRSDGLIDRTVIVVVGDHGEGLGDHGELTHGLTIYDSVLRVPLIVRAPGSPSGRVRDTVRTVDLMPTICELVGVECPSEVQGASLAMLLAGGPPLELEAYSETVRGRLQYGWSPVFGLTQGEWKYIAAPAPELYRVASDPGETANLIDEEPAVARRLEARLASLRETIRSPHASRAAVWIDAATRDRLTALGYLSHGGVEQVEIDSIETMGPGMVNPHMGVSELMGRIVEVRNLLASGKAHRALDILDTVLQLDPTNPEALLLEFLAHYSLRHGAEALESARAYAKVDSDSPRAFIAEGMALMALDRPEEAVAPFRRATELDPTEGDAFTWLCIGLAALDRRSEAGRACRSALELDPDTFEARSVQASLLARDQRFEEALADLDALSARYPAIADLHHRRGVVLLELGQVEAAREALETALRLNPRHDTAHFALALLERRAGRPDQSRVHLEQVLSSDPDGVQAAAARRLLDELDAAAAEIPRIPPS
jgi:arylsulfatase A-like enzyme/tetratricopeptide (TPR) repeat protein